MKRLAVPRRERQLKISAKKLHPLSPQDLRDQELKEHLAIGLKRAYASARGAADRFSILDVGCGRGDTVALLRRDGWHAYGAEIDPDQIALARSGMEALGHDPKLVLSISSTGAIDADDEAFDFVISEQVLEHVEDLEAFVNETWRVLKAGGTALHVFPSLGRPLEPHIKQPFVHWLPRGPWRSFLVHLWVALGVESGFARLEGGPRAELEGLSRQARAHAYLDYLHNKTHYRSRRHINTAFLQRFVAVDEDVVEDVIALRLGSPVGDTLLPRLLQRLCIRFYSTAIFAQKGPS